MIETEMSKNIYILFSGSDYLHMCSPDKKHSLHIFTPVPHRKTTISQGKYCISFHHYISLHIVWKVHNSSKAKCWKGSPTTTMHMDFRKTFFSIYITLTYVWNTFFLLLWGKLSATTIHFLTWISDYCFSVYIILFSLLPFFYFHSLFLSHMNANNLNTHPKW